MFKTMLFKRRISKKNWQINKSYKHMTHDFTMKNAWRCAQIFLVFFPSFVPESRRNIERDLNTRFFISVMREEIYVARFTHALTIAHTIDVMAAIYA